jgi:hypothetical protein
LIATGRDDREIERLAAVDALQEPPAVSLSTTAFVSGLLFELGHDGQHDGFHGAGGRIFTSAACAAARSQSRRKA